MKLYAQRGQGSKRPTSVDLLNALKSTLDISHNVYIILDALDECSDQCNLLGFLTEIANWELDNVHIIATSRRERRIEDGLTHLVSGQLDLDSDRVDADIRVYLNAQLDRDTRFQKWTAEERLEIKDTLIRGARGM